MSKTAAGVKTPIWFWIVAGLATLWNASGVFDFIMTNTRNEAYLAAFTPEQMAYFTSFPMWFTIVWAIAVFAAFIGSVLLLLRMALAVPVFLASVACYVISLIYSFGLSNGSELMGMTGVVMSALIGLILLGLLVLARWAKARGILT